MPKTRSSWCEAIAQVSLLATFSEIAGSAPTRSDYLIRSWGTDNGLPQNSILDLVQTREGYIWIATFGGLARFDGISFTTFDPGATPELPSNRILGLSEGTDGSLWIATQESGVSRYKDGSFSNYSQKDGLPSNYTHAIHASRDGTLWVATRKGLVRRRDGSFQVMPWPAGLPPEVIISLAESADGSILAAVGSGVLRFREGSATTHQRASTTPVLSVFAGKSGSEWFGTSKGLYRLRDPATRVGPVAGEVWVIREDRSGALWAGGAGSLWKRTGDSWNRYSTSDGMSESWVRSFVEDSEGNVWAGTNARGLNRLTKRRIDVYGTGQGFPSENTVPVIEDRDGAMWIGTTCGGLIRFQNGEYTRYDAKDGLLGTCVWSLAQDRNGAIWAGTRDGLSRFANGVFQNYTRKNSSLSDPWVTSILEDRSGKLWFGTGNGLNRMDSGHFVTFHKRDGLVEDDVRFVTEAPDGAIWIGTTGGMSRLQGGKFRNYTTADGLPHNFVRAIHFDPVGTVWVGTYGGGLARLRDGKFTRFNKSNGLPENVVSRILDDANGNLWLSGNRGIHRVNRGELNGFAEGRLKFYQVSSFGTADGMENAECNGGGSPAGWKTRDGRLWFPTQKGVSVVDPQRLQGNGRPPAVLIEKALVDRKPASLTGGLQVPPGMTDLEIQYAGLSFSAPEQIRMQYRMEPLDQDWVESANRRSAYYTHLPAGSYRFRVRAANADGVWSIEDSGVAVTVIPPFWETPWFRVSAAIVLLGIVASLLVRRDLAAKREANRQASYSRQLIASQEAERQRIAGELHDSLGQTLAIIKNRALMGLNDPENRTQAIEQLDEISHAASHALEEVREIAFNLRPYQLDRLGLSKAIEAMLSKAEASGQIRFSHELGRIGRALTPEMESNLFRIVQESVSNVIKHSRATQASVRGVATAAGIELLVTDNGIGFPAASLLEDGCGFGLRGMAERTRLLGGHLEVQSAPGKGTVVRIVLNGASFGQGEATWSKKLES